MKVTAKKSAARTTSNKSAAPTRGRKPVDPNETREDKFKRLGAARMSKTLNAMRQVKNLARYPHTPEQGSKIVAALQSALDSIEQSFSETKQAQAQGFSFDD